MGNSKGRKYETVPRPSQSFDLPLANSSEPGLASPTSPGSEDLSDQERGVDALHRRGTRHTYANAGSEDSAINTSESNSSEDEDEAVLNEMVALPDNDKEGLLSGAVKVEAIADTILLSDESKSWLERVPIRIIVLSGLALLVLLLLGFIFNPASRVQNHAKENSWYGTGAYGKVSGAPGTYDASSSVQANPLPKDGKFGDVPFANIDSYSQEDSDKSTWAGGSGAIEATSEIASDQESGRELKSNGTHLYERTVIIVSLDGVRADYLERGLTPHLLNVSRRGLRSKFLKPVFPSLTFPNHYSMITGLYPASHGIVANDFVDPSNEKEFVYTDPQKSWAPEWWGGEPIWATAVRNKLRSAVLMWPGPPVMRDGIQPTYWYPFHDRYHHSKKAAKVAEWLDMSIEKRPNLILAYAPEVDQEGHRSGPNSKHLEHELLQMDSFAKELTDNIAERNLTDIVDIIFVSDHGMTSTHNERLVFLDDILGKEGFDGIASNEGWPSAGLRFKQHINQTDMIARLEAAASDAKSGFAVFTHETMPERWHFSGHQRIAPVYVVPKIGWAISNRHDFHVTMKGDYVPKGNHGYDNDEPSMHAIFVAHGPFATFLKSRLRSKRGDKGSDISEESISVIPGFANLELYNLVMILTGVSAENRAPNNGTIGFWNQYIDDS